MKRFLERRFECKGTLTASPAPFSVGLQGGTEKLTILFVNLLKQQFVKTTVEGEGGGVVEEEHHKQCVGKRC